MGKKRELIWHAVSFLYMHNFALREFLHVHLGESTIVIDTNFKKKYIVWYVILYLFMAYLREI